MGKFISQKAKSRDCHRIPIYVRRSNLVLFCSAEKDSKFKLKSDLTVEIISVNPQSVTIVILFEEDFE